MRMTGQGQAFRQKMPGPGKWAHFEGVLFCVLGDGALHVGVGDEGYAVMMMPLRLKRLARDVIVLDATLTTDWPLRIITGDALGRCWG